MEALDIGTITGTFAKFEHLCGRLFATAGCLVLLRPFCATATSGWVPLRAVDRALRPFFKNSRVLAHTAFCTTVDDERCATAEIRAQNDSKEARTARRDGQRRAQDWQSAAEGIVYGPGIAV